MPQLILDDFASFGAALRHFRRSAGLQQEELAARAGVSVYTISNLERGVAHAPHKDTIQLLARALNLSPDELALFTAAAPTRLQPSAATPVGQFHGSSARTELPNPLTPLIGRDREMAEVRMALAGPAPDGDRWYGRTVAAWIGLRVARRICREVGWTYLRRLGARWRLPRPRHARADPAAQQDFKDRLRPLLRQVAIAFPTATVELWAVDEHRIGLKPILRKVWTLEEPRPLAPVQHRFAWRYLVGFVHPASGRAVFHLASSVSIALFEVELAAFAREVGAGPERQIVLVLDRAGWHASVRLKVPEHIHLLFLPPLYGKVSFSLPGRQGKGGGRA